jgi:hypothetical protein
LPYNSLIPADKPILSVCLRFNPVQFNRSTTTSIRLVGQFTSGDNSMSRIFYPAVLFALGCGVGWLASSSRLSETIAQEKKAESTTADPIKEKRAEAEADNPLATLEWLVGDWVDGNEESTVEFSCHFTKNRSFLVRSFRTFKQDGAGMSGMQIIAWDPARETIRSWTYDSAGGFGEETWSQTGDRYTIRAKYTLPDGGVGSALNVLTYVNEDVCTWKSINREIDGEFQPDSAQVIIVRAADEGDEKPTKKEGN